MLSIKEEFAILRDFFCIGEVNSRIAKIKTIETKYGMTYNMLFREWNTIGEIRNRIAAVCSDIPEFAATLNVSDRAWSRWIHREYNKAKVLESSWPEYEKYVKCKSRSLMQPRIYSLLGETDEMNEKNPDYRIPSKILLRLKRCYGSHRVFRDDCGGKWIGGFFKRTSKYYFELPWYPGETKVSPPVRLKILRERAELRRLLDPDISALGIYGNAIYDLYGNSGSRIYNGDGALGLKHIAKMCRSVCCMTIGEIIDKRKETIKKLQESTRPKSGLIISRKFNKGEYKGSGASKGREMARKYIFAEVYKEGESIEKTLKKLSRRGINISKKTYYKYRRWFRNIENDSIKTIEIC